MKIMGLYITLHATSFVSLTFLLLVPTVFAHCKKTTHYFCSIANIFRYLFCENVN